MGETRFSRFHRFAGLGVLLAGVYACSSFPTQTGRSNSLPLNLDTADKIRVGETQLEEIQAMLGAPRIKLPGRDPSSEAWLFCDQEKCSLPRLTLYVDLSSKTVTSVNVRLREDDPERDLDRARARYPSAHLKLERYLYSYRDYFETVASYVDSTGGLVMGYDETQKKVSAIARSVPPVREPQLTQSGSGFPKISKLPDRETASGQ